MRTEESNGTNGTPRALVTREKVMRSKGWTAARIKKFQATMKRKREEREQLAKGGHKPKPPKERTKLRGHGKDALIYINHALFALLHRDYDGVELYTRLAKRALEGR